MSKTAAFKGGEGGYSKLLRKGENLIWGDLAFYGGT